jgi:hypothetical protein
VSTLLEYVIVLNDGLCALKERCMRRIYVKIGTGSLMQSFETGTIILLESVVSGLGITITSISKKSQVDSSYSFCVFGHYKYGQRILALSCEKLLAFS